MSSIIQKFYTQLRYKKGEEINYRKLFPGFFQKDNPKTKILFVSPRMDETGVYNHIIPALYLVENGKYSTSCITNIEKSKQELDSSISGYTIPEHLVKRANIIVLPFLDEDLSGVYRALRGINENVRIIYTVDYNFYNVPRNHEKYETFRSKEAIEAVEMNMIYADKVFLPDQSFMELLGNKLTGKYDIPKNLYAEIIDTYITFKTYEGINFEQPREIEKGLDIKRLGIVSRWFNKENIRAYQKLFDYIFKEYKDKIEVVFWGIDPFERYPGKIRHAEKGKLQEVIPATKKRYRLFQKDAYVYFYRDLHNMNFDGILYLEKENDFNKYSKDPHLFLDAMYYNIPVISNRKSRIFNPEEHYLYGADIEELKSRIDDFYKDTNFVQQAVVLAREFMLQNLQFNGDNIERAYLSFAE